MRQAARLGPTGGGHLVEVLACDFHRWIFEEDEVDTIDPGDQLVRVETEHAYFNISVPPWITQKCRVKALHKKVGEQAAPGELLISLEPLSEANKS